LPFPAWFIVIVHAFFPLLAMAYVPPELVQPPELPNVTGNPEVELATTVKLLPSVAVAGAGTVTMMLCDARVALTVSVTGVAAE